MTSDLYARLADAARTALEVIRRERDGDLRGVIDLVTTYGDEDKGLIIGVLASVINHMLAAIDDLAVSHGEAVRGEDVLKMMAVSLEPPATARLRADASATTCWIRSAGQRSSVPGAEESPRSTGRSNTAARARPG
ncbi:MAG TPA: hypothetical protein VGF32_21800 [Streptosporangiaceae bacterium]